MDGKYIPTQNSNANNDKMSNPRLCDPNSVAMVIAVVANNSMIDVDFSIASACFFCKAPNTVDPSRHDAMKHEKIFPKGTSACGPYREEWIAAFIAGGHCNTKMYMEPVDIIIIIIIIIIISITIIIRIIISIIITSTATYLRREPVQHPAA